MTREEVQKVIDEGGHLRYSEYLTGLFKAIRIVKEDGWGLHVNGRYTNMAEDCEQIVYPIKWRKATKPEINQYVNGTDKQT